MNSDTYVKYEDTPEHPTDSFCDIATGTLGFRGSAAMTVRRIIELRKNFYAWHVHRNKFHSLEGECSLDNDGKDAQEAIETDMVRLEAGAGDRARMFPVLSKHKSRPIVASQSQV